jgi:IS5 family transposase
LYSDRKLKTYLGRIIRDIKRQIADDAELDTIFKWPLYQASTVLEQRQRQRGRKIYSLHAHEVECIGKGKAHAPYEFGTKVSIATTLKRSKGGQFALNAMALPGNPYDGHTLKTIIPAMQDTIGADIERILADAGYPSAMRSVVATATTRPTATGSESSPPARNAA